MTKYKALLTLITRHGKDQTKKAENQAPKPKI